MNIRVGTDLIEIGRFKRKLTSSPSILRKLFSPHELQNTDPAHLAGIFAVKEAALKALDIAPGNWLKIEISYKESGKQIQMVIMPAAGALMNNKSSCSSGVQKLPRPLVAILLDRGIAAVGV